MRKTLQFITILTAIALFAGMAAAQSGTGQNTGTAHKSGAKGASSTASGTTQNPSASPASTPAAQNSASPLKNQKDKLSYAIGMQVGGSIARQGIDVDTNTLMMGLKDAMAGKPIMTEDDVRATMMQLQADMQTKQKEAAENNKKEGEAFLASNKTQQGVVTLPSGLQYKILKEGTGPKPTTTDSVVCNYRGTFINGKEFDSSYKHGQPATFPVTGVIKGWTEALQLMPVGSKWQLFIPSDLAYGERGYGGDIPGNSTLIFEIELLSIQDKQGKQ